MRIGLPRRGTELIPEVFQRWQQQVTNGLRSLQTGGIKTATVTINFPSIAAAGEETSAESVPGARSGAAVIVSTVAAPPSGVVLDGYVSDTDEVTVRASNLTASPVNPASADYVVTVINQEAT